MRNVQIAPPGEAIQAFVNLSLEIPCLPLPIALIPGQQKRERLGF